jgi:hypothetical protein
VGPFSRNLVSRASLFSSNLAPKQRMFSVRAVYVLGPLHIVIVGLGADMPSAQRQTRLATLKSLDLTFFVITEHHCLSEGLR